MYKFLLIIIPLILLSCQGKNETKEDVIKKHKKEKKKMEDRSDSLRLATDLNMFEHLLKELEDFYDTKEFREKGFSEDSKYNKWLKKVEKLSKTRGAPLLSRIGISYGDLQTLGMSLVSGKTGNIEDNKHYKMIKENLDRHYGIKEPPKSKNISTEGLLIGKWKVDNNSANIHFTYSIYKSEDSYFGIEENKGKMTRQELSRDGDKYYVKASKGGEYYKVFSDGNAELFDSKGSLKDIGFIFTKIK